MISQWFLRFGVFFAVAGMSLGIYMGITHDHTLAPVHAHVNLVGWVTMFLAGLYYQARPECDRRLSKVHFTCSLVGLLILAPGLAGVMLGYPWGEPAAAAGSIITLASMLVFAVIVLTAPARRAA